MTQFRSHPLKWSDLKRQVEQSGMEDPDIWIEDCSRYGRCVDVVPEMVCEEEDTDAIEASFSPICDTRVNRVTIRHHF